MNLFLVKDQRVFGNYKNKDSKYGLPSEGLYYLK